MQIDINNKIINISQPGYVDTLLNRFHVDQNFSKSPSKIPVSHYDVTDENLITLSKQDQSLFMKIVGSLLFLSTRSRPDISFRQLSFPIHEICDNSLVTLLL